MKKLLAFIAIFGALTFGVSPVFAQDENTSGAENAQSQVENISEDVQEGAEEVGEAIQDAAETMDEVVNTAGEDLGDLAEEGTKEVLSFHQEVKRLFIEGGANFMALVLICLIPGLALAIERIIYLNMATTNTNKLLLNIEEALNRGGTEAAKEVCRNTRGPVAYIF
jgi:biopolymer transport protein ExbB